MATAPVVSHGRGGQGNIGPDPTPYADAEIVRKGPEGDQGDGAYSAGRGGLGNIGSPHLQPATSQPHDTDVVPEMAVRQPSLTDGDHHHTGRGGQGNIEKVTSKESTAPPTTTNTTTAPAAATPTTETAGARTATAPVNGTGARARASASEDAPVGLADKLKYKIFGRK